MKTYTPPQLEDYSHTNPLLMRKKPSSQGQCLVHRTMDRGVIALRTRTRQRRSLRLDGWNCELWQSVGIYNNHEGIRDVSLNSTGG